MHELDLRRHAGAVHRTDQVGDEHEAALEHRDHEQVGRRRRGDGFRHLLVATRDRGLVVKHPDAPWLGHGLVVLSHRVAGRPHGVGDSRGSWNL
jgi:hypothetical protein